MPSFVIVTYANKYQINIREALTVNRDLSFGNATQRKLTHVLICNMQQNIGRFFFELAVYRKTSAVRKKKRKRTSAQ